ncbi:MAG: response regulator [Eubacterium sp.]|nr:response regulator [Eubacterium sp.]
MEKKYRRLVNDTVADTLLIVDDDPVNRTILGKLFSNYYTVVEAENGHMGMEQILRMEKSLCAILLDVMMPGMNGIEVLRHLKELGVLENVPVFIITAENSASMMKEAYELGVMDVISKPVVPYMVTRRVRSIVELFETRRHLSVVVEKQGITLLEQAEKIIMLNQGMIEALATAIEFRSEESGGHVQRISRITRLMLENTVLGDDLDNKEIDDIVLAAVMHDVGKITIPDAVLTKPGKLNDEEEEIMKSHTTKGVAILERIPQLRDSGIYKYACDIARHHHERWDGGGYPDGLKEDEISLWAQIVSLADVYDALSCRRVYKPPYPREEVLEMIRSGECGVFNPLLLECFFSIEDQIYEMYEGLPETHISED